MDFLMIFSELSLTNIVETIIAGIVIHFLLMTNKKLWIEKHPRVKSQIEMVIYFFWRYIYFPVFSIGLACFGIAIALFDPNYHNLPRFSAAWIAFGMGLSATILFSYISKGMKKPQNPNSKEH